MKRILITFALVLTGLALFGQSPRIRLNQITKDSITGSVVLSGSDSNMVYSRDFFINFQDSVLLLFGDTLSTTSNAFSGVTTDLTLTGNGTSGSELKVDTGVIATVSALADSLAGIISSVTTDLTLTGDGTVASPLKVDTTLIGTKGDLNLYLPLTGGTLTGNLTGTTSSFSSSGSNPTLEVNHSSGSGVGLVITKAGNGEGLTVNKTSGSGNAATITGTLEATTLVKTGGTSSQFLKADGTTDNSTYLTGNQTITLSGDATGSGTTAITVAVVDDSHNHIISNVDNLQDSLNSRMVTDFSNVSGTLPIANGGTGSATQNFVDLTTAQTVGGAKTFSSSVTVKGDVLVGGSDYANNALLTLQSNGSSNYPVILYKNDNASSTAAVYHTAILTRDEVGDEDAFSYTIYKSNFTNLVNRGFTWNNYTTPIMRLTAGGNLGIGTTSPAEKLDVNGKVKIGNLTGTGGNAVYENGGVLGVASDARFKSYIGDLDNGIEKVLNLKPKYFIDNRNSTFQQLGFYAQEVKSVINEASYPIGNTEYLGINDRAIIAVTVKAIQEQQAIIESQASEIETLKTQIQLILNEIEQIKNK